MNDRRKFNKYIVFWLTQSLSELGSSMTSFALVIWAYGQTGSALSVSLMTFCSYVPFVIVSLFAGSFLDRHKKKSVLLLSDTFAAVCTIAVCLLALWGKLEIWHIYLVNILIGFMNAFQSPALSVSLGILVPKEYRSRASGMSSFSSNLITVVTPMLAAALFSFGGLKGILLIDLLTFLLGAGILFFFISIPEASLKEQIGEKQGPFTGFLWGWRFLKAHKGILYIILSMSMLNFFSRLTYENILSPMILARSQSSSVLGIVTGILGAGGILGGILVSLLKLPKDNQKVMYLSAALSFLFGDITMGLGQNVYIWSLGALFASVPIPFILAAQNVMIYHRIPAEIQGRIFAVRNALQFGTIPVGILLGGFLADYVFEPFMESNIPLALFLTGVTGEAPGKGMAVMFLCTGILGFSFSIFWMRNRHIREISRTD